MTPNQETVRLAAKVMTDRQFEVWRLLQSGWSPHRIAIATGLTRRTIRDHDEAGIRNLARAIENGDQWPATQPGFDTSTANVTTPTSPKPSAPSSSTPQPATPPVATAEPSEESPPSAPTSPAPSPAPPPTSLTKTTDSATLAPRHRARERPSSHPGTHAPGGKQHPDPPATPIRAHYAQKPAPPGALPHEQTDSGGQVTPYGDRRRAGEYDPDGTAGPTESTVHDPASGGTTVQVDADEVTLAELKEQAESLGLPTYGTKAQLAERIANA
jgi:hypothetical protein